MAEFVPYRFSVALFSGEGELLCRGELHARGALRGARPEDAFRVVQHPAPEGVLRFDLEIAPAFPIDRIRLTFVHDRDTGGGTPSLEVTGG